MIECVEALRVLGRLDLAPSEALPDDVLCRGSTRRRTRTCERDDYPNDNGDDNDHA
jgi:hypothetical protein